MEILAQKIADFLEIGIEKAVEIYPIVREQFIAYELLERINSASFMLVFITIVIGVVIMNIIITWEEEFGLKDEEKTLKKLKKVYKILVIMIIFFIIVSFATSLLQVLFAPDLIMFKELL